MPAERKVFCTLVNEVITFRYHIRNITKALFGGAHRGEINVKQKPYLTRFIPLFDVFRPYLFCGQAVHLVYNKK